MHMNIQSRYCYRNIVTEIEEHKLCKKLGHAKQKIDVLLYFIVFYCYSFVNKILAPVS